MSSTPSLTGRTRLARLGLRLLRRAAGFEVYRLLVLTPDQARDPGPVESCFSIQPLSPEFVRKAADEGRTGLSREDAEAALARGEECFGAVAYDQLVSSIWLSPVRAHVSGRAYVDFDGRYTYSRWTYTDTAYRGQRINPATKLHAFRAMAARGKLGILSLVNADNPQSMQAGVSIGCRRAGLLVTMNVGGHCWVWTSPQCRHYGVRLVVGPPSGAH